MISPELLRRYPFFASLSTEQLNALAKISDELSVEAGHVFFKEGEPLDFIYVLVEGSAAITLGIPAKEIIHKLSEQFSRELQLNEIVVSSIAEGEMFGWSGIIPPHTATADSKATAPSKVISIDCRELRKSFETDHQLGYILTQTAAKVISDRLKNMRIETLAQLIEDA